MQGTRKSGKMSEVMLGTIPYVIAMLAIVAALIAFAQIALFLPATRQQLSVGCDDYDGFFSLD